MIFDIKKIYILSGISIFNLIAVAIISTVPIQGNNKADSINNPIPTPIVVVNKIIKKVTKFATPTSNLNQSQTQNVPSAIVSTVAPSAIGCIVTIDSVKYDVSEFKKIHSGGDIFTCGTDVSNEFWSRHNQRQLNQMQRYRI